MNSLPGFATLATIDRPLVSTDERYPALAEGGTLKPWEREDYLAEQARGAKRRGEAAWWRFCAPRGACCAYPNLGVEHGPRICGPGAYAA